MTRGHGDQLTDLMIEKVIAALLRCHSFEEAAQQLGICRATLWRWQRLPKFQRAYKQACDQLRKSNVADFLDDLRRKPEPALSH